MTFTWLRKNFNLGVTSMIGKLYGFFVYLDRQDKFLDNLFHWYVSQV